MSIKAKLPKSLQKDLSKIAILSSYTIWNARHEPSWGPRTNLNSNCNCFVIALFCMYMHMYMQLYFGCFVFVFCLALHPIMVTFTYDLGTWPGLLYTIFLLASNIAVFVYIIANKDCLNNTQEFGYGLLTSHSPPPPYPCSRRDIFQSLKVQWWPTSTCRFIKQQRLVILEGILWDHIWCRESAWNFRTSTLSNLMKKQKE